MYVCMYAWLKTRIPHPERFSPPGAPNVQADAACAPVAGCGPVHARCSEADTDDSSLSASIFKDAFMVVGGRFGVGIQEEFRASGFGSSA